MGLRNNYSDYGSGSSSSSSSWMSQQDIRWSGGLRSPSQNMEYPNKKQSSYSDLVMGRCTLDDVMREFQMNGSDSPYNPEEDRIWGQHTELPLSGMGPPSAYLRQRSWPAPERSPAKVAPASRRLSVPLNFATSTPVFDEPPAFAPEVPVPSPVISPSPTPVPLPSLTDEQSRVLSSLPQVLLHSLLKQMNMEKRAKTFQECRFCKNNGERETYYRSHVLKDANGCVACPVLRAYVCMRCGAHGDRAHTIKYCPLSTNEERMKSSAMMRSVRLASGRRRGAQVAPSAGAGDYIVFGDPPRAAGDIYANYDNKRAASDVYTNYETPRAASDVYTNYETPRAASDVYTNYETPRAASDVYTNYETPRAASDVYTNYETPRAASDAYTNFEQSVTGDVFAKSDQPRAAGDVFANCDFPLDPLWAALEQKLML